MKKITTSIETFLYFYPCTVALVGARLEDRLNFMSCAWHTALSSNPPLFGVMLAKKRFTHRLISEAREFTVNFIPFESVKLSAQMGRRSGGEIDKIKEFQVRVAPSKVIRSPIIEEAYVSFECKLIRTEPFGDHDLFVGEILAVHEEPDSFDAAGLLNISKVRPLLYMGCDMYVTVNPDTLNRVLPD
ncbi:MAG TPA: flavin reductase family protein [Candidatus Aminicenantes bacterium]|nr:flavin reductase family protein [Candidatus Aminicenantes bacterium]